MSPWTQLYEQHRVLQSSDQRDIGGPLRARLRRLAELGHCNSSIQGRFTHERRGDVREWYIKGPVRQGTEPLTNVHGLVGAALTVLAMQRGGQVTQFTVMVQGVAEGGRDWTVAVHLDPVPRGEGACGHALLHCHVGPTLALQPKVRVPLPALQLPHALDWVLTQVIPAWEPSPWGSLASPP